MPLTLSDVQGDVATASVVDQAGALMPADPANPITWAVDDPSICAVTDNGNGTAALKAAKPGSCNLTATDAHGDADTEVVTVTFSAASNKLGISFSVPA